MHRRAACLEYAACGYKQIRGMNENAEMRISVWNVTIAIETRGLFPRSRSVLMKGGRQKKESSNSDRRRVEARNWSRTGMCTALSSSVLYYLSDRYT